ncbi:LSU ribosomal protein L6P [Malonomonas rubra DSM 5091]|uniref:Large ribosomal subunit protein uL6 n=1 Tax=Malonomonas rubra DSM 5091 TaxID=1122189 RepID=A0A1M6MTN6_MALRU|nr:50S ribosomal protein L6 [Malonomonas rubra]SHJ86739.1 LSU ribosomal protein L6P [Malonomonas rubra DSM 5091]
MSRIGKLPVAIPAGVKVSLDGTKMTVQGPKGTLSQELHERMNIAVETDQILVTRPSDAKDDTALHGLTRALINNMVVGVTAGFQKDLEINGVGYRAEISGKVLTLSLGYSHPVVYELPDGISVEVEKQTKLSVKGIDKQLVGSAAAKIRSFRAPEPYKGKGIKYADERIVRKAGKAGK